MNTVGVDIGNSSIKIVEVGKQGNELQLIHAGIAAIPPRILLSESNLDQEELSRTLKKLFNDCDIKMKDVNVSLLESQLFTRIIEMPQLSDKELVQALRWEAEQYIPMPLDEVNMDFAVLEKQKNGSKMQVLLVAAPLRLLDKYLIAFERAGLDVKAFENEALTLGRLFSDPQKNILVIDMGESTTGLYIFHQTVLSMVRTISIGSAMLSKAILTELNLPMQQAEEYKKTYGMDSAQLEGKIFHVLQPIIDNMFTDVQQSFTFFKEKHPDEVMSRIVVTGGGSQLPKLASYIQEKMVIETIVGNPWERFVVDQKIAEQYTQEVTSFSVATGLAIRDLV